MRIGIVGAGPVGTSLGKALLAAGHDVMFSSRTPSSVKMQTLAAETGAGVGTVAETVAFGEVVALAMSWDAIPGAVQEGGDWTGKIIIDANNRFGPSASGKSAAEDLAALTGGRVVKAFNTIGAEHYTQPRVGGEAASMLIAGDDAAAKAVVGQLAADIGFEPVDAGDLAAARHVENLAALWVHLAFRTPLGRNIAFRLLRG